MAFRTAEQSRPVYLVRGAAQTIEQPWTSGDAATVVAPTSATVTVRNAAGNAAGSPAISGAAATITGSIMTYAITSAILDAETLGAHWQIEWTPVYGGVTYPPIVRRASLCRRDLVCPVSNRSILTVHPEWTTYPAGQSSWTPQIEAAWDWVCQQIEETGRRPELVVGADTLYRTTLFKALGVISRHLSTYVGDVERYAMLADYFDHPVGWAGDGDKGGQAQIAWAAWRADYDTDGDGQVQSDEADALLHGAAWPW